MILDGKKLALRVEEELKEKIQKESKKPGLAVILVGDDPASHVYVRSKKRACSRIGIQSFETKLPGDITRADLLEVIHNYNNNDEVNGILVQLPLPKHLDTESILNEVNIKKDVDCFHEVNVGKLTLGRKCLPACTPRGIIELIEHYDIMPIEGVNATVIGRSAIVGIPMANLLRHRGATVTICHSKTKDLRSITLASDLVVVAVGKPKMLDESYFNDRAVVIDVGMNRHEGKLMGDVDFEKVKDHVLAITPVPGGVGPLTIAMLMRNTYEAFLEQKD